MKGDLEKYAKEIDSLFLLQKEIKDNAKSLCIEILKKNNNIIEFDRDLISDEMIFDTYDLDGRITEYLFTGASFIDDTLTFFGIKYDRPLSNIEAIRPLDVDADEFIYIAKFLLNYLNNTNSNKN